ncbi:MAG: dihydroxyacetone kinase, phosphoprotein-dependent, subunit [Acidimicrobiaceae bacterium]|nr:dihydroxyacetone kinase, phosphoprotein-dependent, subunit [Acidimicrobiaceae bacterium]
MSVPELTRHRLRASLLLACDRFAGSSEELCALDAAAGDGDLGATLATGFKAVAEKLPDLGEVSPGAMLVEVGNELARKAPSTIGTLLAWAHIMAGRELEGVEALSPADVATFFRSAQKAVSDRGKAKPGERTVLDAMFPSADAAECAASKGQDVIDIFRSAAAAAASGAEETTGMSPRHGRAGWIGERAKGKPDAGATAWAIYVSALADGVSLG